MALGIIRALVRLLYPFLRFVEIEELKMTTDEKQRLFRNAIRDYEVSNGLALSRDHRFSQIAETVIDDIHDDNSAAKAFEIALERWYEWLTAPRLSEMG